MLRRVSRMTPDARADETQRARQRRDECAGGRRGWRVRGVAMRVDGEARRPRWRGLRGRMQREQGHQQRRHEWCGGARLACEDEGQQAGNRVHVRSRVGVQTAGKGA